MKNSRRILLGFAAAISIAGAGLAFALDPPVGDPDVIELLGGMSYVPDKTRIEQILGPQAADELISVAEDESVTFDAGMRIRSLRALALYKESPDRPAVTAALRRTMNRFTASDRGVELLYLRASMLSLARVEGATAVAELTPLLSHQSRDIRAACAQALGITASSDANQPLRDRALIEEQAQVLFAIDDALFELGLATDGS